MSSWLRSSRQELCRENKSSLTASLSHRKPLFLAAGYNCSSCSPIRSWFQICYLPRSRWSSRRHRYFLMRKISDTYRDFTIAFSYWNKRLQKFKLNDVLSVHRACVFIKAVQLHHKSPGNHNWQHHGGPLENCPNRKKNTWKRGLLCRISFYQLLKDERQLVLRVQQHCIIMPKPHGSCGCGVKLYLC